MSIYDPVLAAAEERRRAELAGNGAYQRGVAAAKAQAIANDQRALEAELVTLKTATIKRDVNPPSRDKYDRAYTRTIKAAERVAAATGKPVAGIPAYLPAPALVSEDTVTIGVPKPAPTPVVKPSGRGGPSPGYPGTDAHQAWLNVQGVK